MADFIRAWDFTRAWGTSQGLGGLHKGLKDFTRVRGLHKKHAHKAPEKKQQQESGLIGLLLLFFGRCAWDFIEDSMRA